MHLLTLNAAGKPLAPPRPLDPRRRRLSQVVGRHVDRTRPHMVAIQRARDPLQPIEEAWVTRGRDRAGAIRPWPRRYLPADAVVVVVYLPLGGGGGASGSRSKSPLSIALGIAAVALIAFAGPLGVAAAGALGLGTTASTLITAGLVLGGSALLSIASRAKANKQATDTREIYGVSGGGNLPKPGDRIPRGYGRSWMKPDLSQPDFSQYDGDDQILYKRHTLGLGRYRPYALRVGKQVIWREDAGFLPPFDDPRNAVEFVYGTASALVPNSNVSATGVGGLLPRPDENPTIAGPFPINQRGALVSRLQIDFQFPQGIARTDFLRSGAVRSNQPGAWSVYFEYAPIDESGAIVGPWSVLYNGNSGSEGARFATQPLRYTRFREVPPGRYAVRGRNVQPDTSQNTDGNATIDAVQWDGASGWVADAAIRPGLTEVCLRIYATKGSQAAAFGEIEVDAGAIIPVWNGSTWSEQETSKAVWAFLDIMRNVDYGGALPDSQLDLGTALGYTLRLDEFDTFDATIRGPVSVYEAAASALLPMRAEPVHLGRYWSLVRDEPKAVRRHVITRRQMLKGSTQLVFDLDTADGAGHVVGEFDQDGDYRNPNQATAIYGEASLTPTRQRWTGVKSFGHAQHLTRWRAAAGAFRRQTAPFGVEMEGRIYKRGDSISVDPWFIDARKVAGVVDNRGNTLILDADVPLAGGDHVVLRDRTGREWGPLALIGQGGSAREIRLDPLARALLEQSTFRTLEAVLSDGRGEMTTVLVGPLATLTENYLIQSVKMSGPDKAQVEALIDDPRVWQAIGAAIAMPPLGGAGLADPESPRIVALTANAVPMAAGLRCDYAIKPGRGAVAFEIGVSYDDGNRFDSRPNAAVTGSIELNHVDPTVIVLRARAFGATGLPGPYFLTELGLPQGTVNAQLPPIDYTDFSADVKARVDKANTALDKALEAIAGVLGNAAEIITERTQRLSADEAIVMTVDAAVTRIDGNTAAIINEANLRSTADSATAEQIQVVVAQAGADRAAVISVENASITRDQALVSAIDASLARLGTNEAAVINETNARATADGALANSITDVSARTDAGTASGRFSIQAVAGPAETARIQALLAFERGGATYGAGYYLDLMTDGSSRFVIDANAFYITNNGSSVPLLSFDGFTLRVPNLVLTAPNVPAGVANQPAKFDAYDYTAIQGAGTNNNYLDPNMVVNIPVENGLFPTIISLYGKVTITGSGFITTPILEIDGNDVGQFLFRGGATVNVGVTSRLPFSCTAVLYLPPGNHTARFRYSYGGGGNPASKFIIDEIHLAAVTPRA